jgi:hypothetical protein
MIFKNTTNLLLSLSILTLCQPAFSQPVPYTEDAYVCQAAPELVVQVEQAAILIDFKAPYEVISPKKAGIEINPHNKFISIGTNPITKNNFLIINPDWFFKLSPAQQQFTIARNLMRLKLGYIPTSAKVIPYLFILLLILLGILCSIVLRKTILIGKPIWMRILSTWLILVSCNLLFINNLQIKLLNHMYRQHDINTIKLTIEKTGDRAAAIEALEKLNSDVNAEAQTNLPFWQNQLGALDPLIKELKAQQ